jgi:thioredoxin reductase
MERNSMDHDVIIIGGSYAGMAAALQLLRARKSVLVIDVGQRRNRFAAHSHGFLGQDGADPAAIAMQARRQLEAYATLTWIEDRATGVTGGIDAFTVSSAAGASYSGRRILFASGVADQLPPVEGLAERWGKHVFHCPYCHGYELGGGKVGIVATGPLALHQAELLTEWGEVTLLANGAVEPDDAMLAALARRGVRIERTPILRIEGDADVLLADGRRLAFAGLFTAPRCTPASPLAAEAGCALEETAMGIQIRVDAMNRSSVPGIFACGDTARMPHSVSLAVGDGAMAGVQMHRSLVWPESMA